MEQKNHKTTSLNTETVNFEVLIKFKFYGTHTKPADLIILIHGILKFEFYLPVSTAQWESVPFSFGTVFFWECFNL